MIDYLKETFKYLPKQEGETERKIAVHTHGDNVLLKFTIYINGVKFWSTLHLSAAVIESSLNTDVPEKRLVKRLSRMLEEELHKKVGARDASNSD